jgi:hypothetical protein
MLPTHPSAPSSDDEEIIGTSQEEEEELVVSFPNSTDSVLGSDSSAGLLALPAAVGSATASEVDPTVHDIPVCCLLNFFSSC